MAERRLHKIAHRRVAIDTECSKSHIPFDRMLLTPCCVTRLVVRCVHLERM